MKKIWIMVLIATAMLMAGCGHKFTQKTIDQAIIKGKTTKKDVIAIFGEPQLKYTSPGMKISSGKDERVLHKPSEVWIYSPHKYKFIDMLEPEPLRIMFDDQGVVSNFDYKDAND
jgi:hypothetical protein